MKRILGFVTLVAILVASTTAWAQSASRYDLNAVAGQATAALSKVGQVERDLADAKIEVQALKADLTALKASRSATAGSVRRANQAFVTAQAKVAELEKQAAVAQASDAAGLARLDKLLTAKPGDWNFLLPTEDPLVGLVRQKCPTGTTPELVVFGANRRFECRPLNPLALTVPAKKERTMPLWAKYSLFISGGAATGAAGTYGVNTIGDGEGTAADITYGAIGGAVIGGVICALTEL